MSLMDDFNAGHKAYYDGVPRYKNPYDDAPHFDDSNYSAWEKGWDQASIEHDAFTKIQQLEAQNKELCVDNEELKKQNKELSRIRANVGMSLVELKIYVEGRSWFRFSREKVMEYIENMYSQLKVPD